MVKFFGDSRLKREIARLKSQLAAKDEEIAGLRRINAAFEDTIERYAWEHRAAGAEFKAHAESLKASQ